MSARKKSSPLRRAKLTQKQRRYIPRWEEAGDAVTVELVNQDAAAFELGFRSNQFEWFSTAAVVSPRAWTSRIKELLPWLIERIAHCLNRLPQSDQLRLAIKETSKWKKWEPKSSWFLGQELNEARFWQEFVSHILAGFRRPVFPQKWDELVRSFRETVPRQFEPFQPRPTEVCRGGISLGSNSRLVAAFDWGQTVDRLRHLTPFLDASFWIEIWSSDGLIENRCRAIQRLESTLRDAKGAAARAAPNPEEINAAEPDVDTLQSWIAAGMWPLVYESVIWAFPERESVGLSEEKRPIGPAFPPEAAKVITPPAVAQAANAVAKVDTQWLQAVHLVRRTSLSEVMAPEQTEHPNPNGCYVLCAPISSPDDPAVCTLSFDFERILQIALNEAYLAFVRCTAGELSDHFIELLGDLRPGIRPDDAVWLEIYRRSLDQLCAGEIDVAEVPFKNRFTFDTNSFGYRGTRFPRPDSQITIKRKALSKLQKIVEADQVVDLKWAVENGWAPSVTLDDLKNCKLDDPAPRNCRTHFQRLAEDLQKWCEVSEIEPFERPPLKNGLTTYRLNPEFFETAFKQRVAITPAKTQAKRQKSKARRAKKRPRR
jgi:hypothetical protein